MGWSSCGTDSKGRPIGYGHRATCDHPGCKAKIDRGLGYACGGMHGTSPGCEGYFCGDHLTHRHIPEEERGVQVCEKCAAELDEIKAEDFRQLLTDIATDKHDSVYEARKAAYEVLIQWDETEDLPPDDRFCTPAQMTLLAERQRIKELYSNVVAEAAGEGATT